MSGAAASRVGFVSLGCPKALVDSERIITDLRARGYEIVSRYGDADLVIVNTCGFIDEAVQESLEAIGEALDENGKVIVTGCLGARRDPDGASMVTSLHPRVLAVTGPHATQEVLAAVQEHLPRPHEPFFDLVPEAGIKLTPPHYAYLKISEGCNHRCSFCIIPSMRGDLVSRPIGEVVREAEALVRGGVRELLVVSQDTSAYGVDLRYRTGFVDGRPVRSRIRELASELGALGAWVRLHYVYPYPSVDELLPLMAEGLVLPYLDVPFQHANARILKLMRRPASGERNMERIAAWRQICPDITLRSTFIVGFPGETEAEFEELLDFLREAELDRVGAFAYSPVDGAAANALPDPVPDEVRQDRLERFMAVQGEISNRRLGRFVGREMDVLVDDLGVDSDGNEIAIARGPGDAPEIDGIVALPRSGATRPGEFCRVRILEVAGHDLVGEPLD